MYTLENAKKLKKEGEIYYKFFIGRKKNIIKNYREKQNEKQAEINKFQNLQGKELFKVFTNDEQINYIGINKGGKGKKKSTVEGSTALQTEINN